MKYFFYFLYNLSLILALPFAWVFAYFNDKFGDSLSGQKDIHHALNKFNAKVLLKPKPVIWFHAASAGEFEQIKPLLSRVREMDVYIFQTFTSSTIFYKVSSDKRFDGVSFLPWDIYPRVNRFIKQLKPNIFINTRHDIWPNLLLSLHRNRVRNILINGNLYADSLRLKPVVKQFNQSLFSNIDHIYTGSEALKTLFENLYHGSISVVGDSRFDQVYERSNTNRSVLISENITSDRRVIIYGSVIASDLSIVSEAIIQSLARNNYLHIIVPHETMERDLLPWEVAFFRQNISTIRKSELSEYNQEQVILWNSVGQLADLYKHAQLAYIGAGFSTGVHSVIEASIYHIPCAHGPRYDILAEAIELVDLDLSSVVSTIQELVQFLELAPDVINSRSQSIEEFITLRLGASNSIIHKEFPLKTQAQL